MKLNIFGQRIEIIRKDGNWIIFYLGNEGKKRLAQDIYIPSEIKEDALVEYISDLCHERSTPNKSEVKILS